MNEGHHKYINQINYLHIQEETVTFGKYFTSSGGGIHQ